MERLIRQGWITPCSVGTLGSRGPGYIPFLPQTHKSEPILLLQTQGWSLGSPSLSFLRARESRYLGPFSFLRSYEFDPSACPSLDPGVQYRDPHFQALGVPALSYCALLRSSISYTEESSYPSFYLSGTQEFSHLSSFTLLGPGLLVGSGMSGPQLVAFCRTQEFRPPFLLLLRLQVSPTCPFPHQYLGAFSPQPTRSHLPGGDPAPYCLPKPNSLPKHRSSSFWPYLKLKSHSWPFLVPEVWL